MLKMLRARKCRLHIGCAVLRGRCRTKGQQNCKRTKKKTHQNSSNNGHGNSIMCRDEGVQRDRRAQDAEPMRSSGRAIAVVR